MADKAVDRQAADIFSLGSNFKAQDSSTDAQIVVNEGLDDLGDIHNRDESDEMTRSSARYIYVGSDLASDFTFKVGKVHNSIHVDSVELSFGAQAAVELRIEGHQHDANAHAASTTEDDYDGHDLDLDTLLGSSIGGWDVPQGKPWANADGDSSCVKLTLRFSVDHKDEVAGNGDHHVGHDGRGLVSCTAEYLGTPSLTTTGWNLESSAANDGNQAADKTVVTGSKALARTLVPAP